MSTALAIAGPDLESKQLWREVKDQYGRATCGMREVLKFGAMMMVLEAHVDQLVQVGQASRKGTSGSGLKGLLAEHAPEINRSTAYRFRDVAKAVQKAYELPARVTKRLTFEQIVTADSKQLEDAEKKAQSNLFEFVDGTSQKSLLDNFREEKNRGGDTGGSRKKLTPEDEHKLYLENAKNDFINALQSVDALHEKNVWKAPSITDSMLSDSADLLAEMAKEMRAWLKIPRRERTKIDVAGVHGRNGSEP